MFKSRGAIKKPRAIRVRCDAIGQPKMDEIPILTVARSIQIMEVVVQLQRECALRALHRELLRQIACESEAPDCQSDVDS